MWKTTAGLTVRFGRPNSSALTFISYLLLRVLPSLLITATRKDGARLGYISSHSKHLTEFDFPLNFHKTVKEIIQCTAKIKSNTKDQSQRDGPVCKMPATYT